MREALIEVVRLRQRGVVLAARLGELDAARASTPQEHQSMPVTLADAQTEIKSRTAAHAIMRMSIAALSKPPGVVGLVAAASGKRKQFDEPVQVPAKKVAADDLVIYTDGSALNNGMPGAKAGSAVYIDANTTWRARTPGKQTSSRAELYAAIAGAGMARESKRVELHTDSSYVQLGVTDPTRLARWVRNGWKTKAGTPVLNVDLWRMLWALIEERRERTQLPISFRKVKGHSGVAGNEAADKLADRAAVQAVASGDFFYAPFPGIDVVLKRANIEQQRLA